jgi:integrase/recombinase XerD
MEMQKLFDQFVRERQFLTNVTEKTLVYYQTAWRKWQPHLVQVHSEAELRPATRAAITELSASGKICARSINTYICVLQTLLNWMFEQELLQKRIKIPKLRCEKKLVSVLAEDDVRKILLFKPRKFYQWRAQASFALMLDTGIRSAEWRFLKMENVNFDAQQLKVYGKGRKERIVPISAECKNILMRYVLRSKLPEGSVYLFPTKTGTAMCNRNALRDLKMTAAWAGVWKISLHNCRHSFATAWVEAGGGLPALKEIMGHASIQTTMNYLHSSVKAIRTQHDSYSPLHRK